MKFIGRHWRIITTILLGWTLFGVFFALQNYVSAAYAEQPLAFSPLLVVWLLCGYSWAVLTPPIVYLAKRFPLERAHFARNAALHLAAAFLAAFLHLSIYILVQRGLFGDPARPFAFWATFQKLALIEFHVDLLTYWILVGLWHLRELNRRYLERERETARLALAAAQLETRLAEARLDALRMQLQPHFLFNTLNSIAVLMREDVAAADRMLVRLSELLRVALKSESVREVALRDELEFLRAYLEIEQVRFEDRLTVDFGIEAETLDARIPNLLLQPLVENAIRHGLAPRAGAGKIVIESRRENGFLTLGVSDDGEGGAAVAETGIGLKNTRERLEKLYGAQQEFEIAAAAGGFAVRIKIPYRL
ncbi:MAG: histidine kinase [Acidobacteria bacterium]|nr:histidine kinase [Acidobacteriota bacterium]